MTSAVGACRSADPQALVHRDRDGNRSVAGVVLAGGRNSRMGADKAFLRLEGEFAIARMLRVLQGCCSSLVIVTNDPQKYASYQAVVVTDEFPYRGPLAAIYSALAVVSEAYAFVTACDMPFLRPEPVRFLIDRVSGQEAVIPRWDGDIEPLHGIYATSLRTKIGAALQGGNAAIRQFLPLIDVDYVAEATMRDVRGAEESFRNLNTPEEAARFAVRLHT